MFAFNRSVLLHPSSRTAPYSRTASRKDWWLQGLIFRGVARGEKGHGGHAPIVDWVNFLGKNWLR